MLIGYRYLDFIAAACHIISHHRLVYHIRLYLLLHVLSFYFLSCLVLSCSILSCLVLSCSLLSCPILSCTVLSCPILACPILSCPIKSWTYRLLLPHHVLRWCKISSQPPRWYPFNLHPNDVNRIKILLFTVLPYSLILLSFCMNVPDRLLSWYVLSHVFHLSWFFLFFLILHWHIFPSLYFASYVIIKDGGGSGFGLYISKAIMELHEDGKNTDCYFYVMILFLSHSLFSSRKHFSVIWFLHIFQAIFSSFPLFIFFYSVSYCKTSSLS